MIVRVPASSANLGPGFDTLGLALTLHAELGLVDPDAEPDTDQGADPGVARAVGTGGRGVPADARRCDAHHPATIAFVESGGLGELWVRCSIPMGRGMGFSGAVRAGGAVLALAQRHGADALDDDRRHAALAVTSHLEGHADNAAASIFGGVVATGGGRVVRVPLALDPAIVVWVPSFVTRTDESRRSLGHPVSFDDAVFNLGRVAMLVGALAAGDVPALRDATADRLHQPARLAATPGCAAALDAALDAGAWCSWLSGSGPTVAAMCAIADAETVATAMGAIVVDGADGAAAGHTKLLRIDHEGAALEGPFPAPA